VSTIDETICRPPDCAGLHGLIGGWHRATSLCPFPSATPGNSTLVFSAAHLSLQNQKTSAWRALQRCRENSRSFATAPRARARAAADRRAPRTRQRPLQARAIDRLGQKKNGGSRRIRFKARHPACNLPDIQNGVHSWVACGWPIRNSYPSIAGGATSTSHQTGRPSSPGRKASSGRVVMAPTPCRNHADSIPVRGIVIRMHGVSADRGVPIATDLSKHGHNAVLLGKPVCIRTLLRPTHA